MPLRAFIGFGLGEVDNANLTTQLLSDKGVSIRTLFFLFCCVLFRLCAYRNAEVECELYTVMSSPDIRVNKVRVDKALIFEEINRFIKPALLVLILLHVLVCVYVCPHVRLSR